MELKPSHEVFAQQLLLTGNKTKSYGIAYPNASYNSCRQLGSLLSRNAYIRMRLRQLMEKYDLGPESCLRKLNELTKANKVQTYGKGRVGVFPDNFIRLESVRTAMKWNALFADVQPESKEDGADT